MFGCATFFTSFNMQKIKTKKENDKKKKEKKTFVGTQNKHSLKIHIHIQTCQKHRTKCVRQMNCDDMTRTKILIQRR